VHDLTASPGAGGSPPHGASSSAAPCRAARRLTVAGRVQGVSFRWSLRRVANRHRVHGWVRNLPDGRLDAWLEGAPDAVETVASWVRTGGPPGAEVSEIDTVEVAPAGHDRFEIRR
jgi:acylphosphatase